MFANTELYLVDYTLVSSKTSDPVVIYRRFFFFFLQKLFAAYVAPCLQSFRSPVLATEIILLGFSDPEDE